jgi:hypothetical protein
MSEVATATQTFAERLVQALRDGLEKVGIEAEIETEPVRGTLLVRAGVVSPQWEPLTYGDRQEVVWRIADRFFSRDEQLHISSIWTLTPDEMEGKA